MLLNRGVESKFFSIAIYWTIPLLLGNPVRSQFCTSHFFATSSFPLCKFIYFVKFSEKSLCFVIFCFYNYLVLIIRFLFLGCSKAWLGWKRDETRYITPHSSGWWRRSAFFRYSRRFGSSSTASSPQVSKKIVILVAF